MAMKAVIVAALGESEEVTLGAAAIPGDVVQTSDGLAAIVQGVGPYASGDKAPVITNAIVRVPSASATTISVSARVGWDATNKLAVSTTGDYALGGAYVAKTNGQTSVLCRLNQLKLT